MEISVVDGFDGAVGGSRCCLFLSFNLSCVERVLIDGFAHPSWKGRLDRVMLIVKSDVGISSLKTFIWVFVRVSYWLLRRTLRCESSCWNSPPSEIMTLAAFVGGFFFFARARLTSLSGVWGLWDCGWGFKDMFECGYGGCRKMSGLCLGLDKGRMGFLRLKARFVKGFKSIIMLPGGIVTRKDLGVTKWVIYRSSGE